jgi:drug/metabolite transporter (DMT)-like permease
LGIALGLGAALTWGLADYFATLATRSVGALRVALGFHLAALVPLTVLVLATGALEHVTWGQVPVFVLLGFVGWLSYLAFYTALSIGPISVVSPIVSGYAAVTVVLAVVIVGEHLPALESAAVVVTIAGVMVASADVSKGATAAIRRHAARGLGLAIAAFVMFGGFLFGVSYYHNRIGWLAPIFLARGFAAVFLLAHVGQRGARRWRQAPPRVLWLIALIAVLDTGGYIFFNIGARHAETSVVATASAPYAVVPIVMGVFLLHERPSRVQWLGVAMLISGLILLGISS